MKVSICIGSACHLMRFQRNHPKASNPRSNANNVSDKVDLNGAFCSGNCVKKGYA